MKDLINYIVWNRKPGALWLSLPVNSNITYIKPAFRESSKYAFFNL